MSLLRESRDGVRPAAPSTTPSWPAWSAGCPRARSELPAASRREARATRRRAGHTRVKTPSGTLSSSVAQRGCLPRISPLSCDEHVSAPDETQVPSSVAQRGCLPQITPLNCAEHVSAPDETRVSLTQREAQESALSHDAYRAALTAPHNSDLARAAARRASPPSLAGASLVSPNRRRRAAAAWRHVARLTSTGPRRCAAPRSQRCTTSGLARCAHLVRVGEHSRPISQSRRFEVARRDIREPALALAPRRARAAPSKRLVSRDPQS